MKDNNKFSEELAKDGVKIAASFTDENSVDEIEKAFSEGLRIVEIRLDLFQNPDDLDSVKSKIKGFSKFPNILTIRSENEGGKWSAEKEHQRLSLYKELIPLVNAVDIEFSSEQIFDDVVQFANQNNVNVIGSYHNFELTPEIEILKQVIEDKSRRKVDITKIATQINNEEDIEILEFLLENYRSKDLIVIGMGEIGEKTRIEFPQKGSLLTFCSYSQSTAPGQISLEEMVEKLN